MAKLKLVINDSVASVVADRAARMCGTSGGTATYIDPYINAVLFLRAVVAEASHVLPAFYFFLGATQQLNSAEAGSANSVKAHSIAFSSRVTVSLGCRKIFDDRKGYMNGKLFANLDIARLHRIAGYWADKGNADEPEILQALALLQALFRRCARPPKHLLASSSLLERRIAFVVKHADAAAAHISTDYYEIDLLDYAHVVAAASILATLIRRFDSPGSDPSYFDRLDAAAWEAAQSVFPGLDGRRLFENFDMAQQACMYYRGGVDHGLQMILYQLPYAIGWW